MWEELEIKIAFQKIFRADEIRGIVATIEPRILCLPFS
jgi:hypothetical protein